MVTIIPLSRKLHDCAALAEMIASQLVNYDWKP